jgi:hypothetical protein
MLDVCLTLSIRSRSATSRSRRWPQLQRRPGNADDSGKRLTCRSSGPAPRARAPRRHSLSSAPARRCAVGSGRSLLGAKSLDHGDRSIPDARREGILARVDVGELVRDLSVPIRRRRELQGRGVSVQLKLRRQGQTPPNCPEGQAGERSDLLRKPRGAAQSVLTYFRSKSSALRAPARTKARPRAHSLQAHFGSGGQDQWFTHLPCGPVSARSRQ